MDSIPLLACGTGLVMIVSGAALAIRDLIEINLAIRRYLASKGLECDKRG